MHWPVNIQITTVFFYTVQLSKRVSCIKIYTCMTGSLVNCDEAVLVVTVLVETHATLTFA